MFEWMTGAANNDAITMLKQDHDNVKELFDQFEKAEGKAEKRKIARQALEELRVHALVEEEIFYPAVRAKLEKNDGEIMNEADEEHHVAKLLIAELDSANGNSDHFDAKFTVLAESVRHHIKEEEGEMLPKAKALDIDFEALGQEMERRKQEVKAQGLPKTSEDKLISTCGPVDSPAKAARAKRAPARRPKTTAAASNSKKKRTARTSR